MQLDLDQAVIVALGSNMPGSFGSAAQAIAAGLSGLKRSGLKPVVTSSLWRSRAWPDPRDPDYLNAVAIVETALDPAEALEALHRLESELGRARGLRNAPRVLDLDLIAHGRRITSAGNPVLPHPRAAERLFVMGPLAEIAPGWTHPVLGATARALAERATVGRDAVPSERVCIAI